MMNNPKRILFVCPTLSQPRFIKRVQAAISSGFEAKVLAYQRGYYRQNKFPSAVEVVSLGEIEDGKYVKRSVAMTSAFRTIKREIDSFQPDVIYAFGCDNLILAALRRPKKTVLVYELGDLRTTDKLGTDFHQEKQGKRSLRIWPALRKVITKVEQHFISQVDFLVLTSQGFASHIKPTFRSRDSQVIVLENKLSSNILDTCMRKKTIGVEGPIKIGLIGLLRYRTIFPLLDVVEKHQGKYSLDIWGAGPLLDEALARIDEIDNASYHGSFKYPEDIPAIYREIDLNFVVYDNRSLNVRLALPNKYYESAFFGVPLLVAENTELWNQVRESETGYCVNPMDTRSIEQALNNLNRSKLSKLQESIIGRISQDSLVDDTVDFFDTLSQS